MSISPRPHERAALAIGAVFVIVAALVLLAVQMFGGLSW